MEKHAQELEPISENARNVTEKKKSQEKADQFQS